MSKHKSESSLKQISDNLEALSIEPSSSMEAKIRAITQNEKTLKAQSAALRNDFASFQRKLAHLGKSVDKFSGSGTEFVYGFNSDNTKSINGVFQGTQIEPKIGKIQYLAEKVDQRIRVLEMAKRAIEDNGSSV